MFINSDDYEWYCFGRILSQYPEFSPFLSQILANRLKLILDILLVILVHVSQTSQEDGLFVHFFPQNGLTGTTISF